ncbi:ScbA/BarX family gamma-butyrolactone biosynthesis protein [Streptomyces sp. NPDC093546]|uniref:ScbA/BarX family gamma-butyrolactone biosynthesis protein n=1 Tax=Streptomyces sp. NPDC093546 TaxID=3366040 RepID=UPI003822BF6C
MNFDRCVPRESVHKAAEGEVLLTDAQRLGDDRFVVAALWNRDHYLAHHGGPASDPVLLAETARQTAIHVSHRFLGVAYGMPFVLSEISVDLFEALPPVGAEPLAVGLDVVCRAPAEGARRLRLELEAEVLVRHRSVGRVRVAWEPMEPRRYALLRRRGGQAPDEAPTYDQPPYVALPPARVGQLAERDVLIAADPQRAGRWWLRLDQDHPVLFDHESDHVPGMMLVEAFRQAGRVAAADNRPGASGVTRLAVTFSAFGELGVPVSLTAEPAERAADPAATVFTLRARQGDRELAHATVRHGRADSVWARLGEAC